MKKIDLHTHTISTPSDSDFVFSLDKLRKYIDQLGIDALAITNHNIFDYDQYSVIKENINIPVFPGIEIDIEGGHLLVIANLDEFDVADFRDKCAHVTRLIPDSETDINLAEFHGVFSDLNKYILIPHYDKRPYVKKQLIESLSDHITSGEVASVSKFKRLFKDTDNLVPVLFSDIRFKEGLSNFPTRHICVDLDEISFNGIKSCLSDRSKVSLTMDGGNDFFQATDDGLMLSTGLNVIIGERSTGKSFTLDKISASSGNVKYIEQFALLQNEETRFNETNTARVNAVYSSFLSPFQRVVEDIVKIDIRKNQVDIDNYLDSLKRFATDHEKQDLYSKCTLYNEELYRNVDLENLEGIIKATERLIGNREYSEVIEKHVNKNSLKLLYLELYEVWVKSSMENNNKSFTNELIETIQNQLRIKSANTFISDVDFLKIGFDQQRLKKYKEVVNLLQVPREIDKREVGGKFKVSTSTYRISGAQELKNISRSTKSFSSAFNKYDNPYQFLLAIKEAGVVDGDLHKYFIGVDSKTLNKDGFKVSKGERSEFNLLHEIGDAQKYDMLLIDEPESSFDNLFLKNEVNKLIKEISFHMPVVIVTHSATVGASIKPDYVALTAKEITEEREIKYEIYCGYPSSIELTNSNGLKIKNYEALLNCLEAGDDAYNERRQRSYEILKD